MLRENAAPQRSIFPFVLLALVMLAALIPVGAAAGGGAYYAQTAAELQPRLETLRQYKPFQTSRILDRNGELLYEFVSNGRRDPVKLDQVSEHVINGTVAIEDSEFWTNEGVDYRGIARALLANLRAGETVSGASTITQQLIKLVVLTNEEQQERVTRKIKEAVLAQQLTDQYTKRQILELYLNEIFYGNLSYGIQAAAQNFFGVDAKDLDLNQGSLLAGLGQLPDVYNPINFVEDGRILPGVALKRNTWLEPEAPLPNGTSLPRQRQVAVLRAMVKDGYVTEPEARAAIANDLQFVDKTVSLKAPHFVFHVQEALGNDPVIGPILANEGGLTITTTLDLRVQEIAQREAKKRIEELEAQKRNIHNAAVVVMQPNSGQILGMVGSIDYNAVKATESPDETGNVLDGNVNVTTRERQPGSALKPFTYLSALNQGALTPGSILWDVETKFPIQLGATDANLTQCAPQGAYWFCPKNFDGRWHGPLRMREGLANSLNIPAVLALKRAGIGPTRQMLHRMGISGLQRDDNYYGLAMTLGGGEVTALDLTTAYNTLASDGRPYKAEPVLSITDRDGQVLRQFTPSQPEPVVDPALVAIVRDFMGDNEARTPVFGRDNPLRLSRPLHAKTGTTDDFRDAWALGYTPYVTVGVWTGNNNNEATERVESTQGGGIILNRIMEAFFKDAEIERLLRGPSLEKPLDFPPPSQFGAVQSNICQIGGSFGQRSSEWFTPKMLDGKQEGCDLYRTVSVVRTPSGGACLPVDGGDYGDQLTSLRIWNLPKSSDEERIVDTSFAYADQGYSGGLPSTVCTSDDLRPPTPTPGPSPSPEASPDGSAPAQPSEPGNPSSPEKPADPAQPPAPQPALTIPNLVGLGENQAKEVLASLGITNVVVDYQNRDDLGDLYDAFPPYVVVSHSPGAGTPASAGTSVVLGVREP